ncbi:MAG: hypothetical protein EOM50_01050 [Erysipelotrichia bacterium]|nr:hypothetical protein [Erysipelotrichia bacterium]
MKRKSFILFVVMMLGFCLSVPATALKAEEMKGVIYHEIKAHSGSELPVGDYFLSTSPDLEDLDYYSATFPPTLNARVSVTGAIENTLENSTWSYEAYGLEKYTQGGFPVDVIQSDVQFDGCDDGHLFASPASQDAGVDGRQMWRYYCNYGGAQDKGPYYLYTLKTTPFTAKDVVIKPSNTTTKISEAKVITKDDLTVSVDVLIDGVKKSIVTTDYEISAYDNSVDPANNDTSIILEFAGETRGTTLAIKYEVSDPIEKVEETPKEEQTPKVEETKASPKTGYTSPVLEIVLIIGLAVGACGFIEYKKRKMN